MFAAKKMLPYIVLVGAMSAPAAVADYKVRVPFSETSAGAGAGGSGSGVGSQQYKDDMVAIFNQPNCAVMDVATTINSGTPSFYNYSSFSEIENTFQTTQVIVCGGNVDFRGRKAPSFVNESTLMFVNFQGDLSFFSDLDSLSNISFDSSPNPTNVSAFDGVTMVKPDPTLGAMMGSTDPTINLSGITTTTTFPDISSTGNLQIAVNGGDIADYSHLASFGAGDVSGVQISSTPVTKKIDTDGSAWLCEPEQSGLFTGVLGQSDLCDVPVPPTVAWEQFALDNGLLQQSDLPYDWSQGINWQNEGLTTLPSEPYPASTVSGDIILSNNPIDTLEGLKGISETSGFVAIEQREYAGKAPGTSSFCQHLISDSRIIRQVPSGENADGFNSVYGFRGDVCDYSTVSGVGPWHKYILDYTFIEQIPDLSLGMEIEGQQHPGGGSTFREPPQQLPSAPYPHSVVNGDVTVSSFTLDGLGGLSSIEEINGNLHLGGTTVPGIDMPNLTRVTGNMNLHQSGGSQPSGQLQSLTGLSSLNYIGGNLGLGYRTQLTTLDGLESVTYLGGTMNFPSKLNDVTALRNVGTNSGAKPLNYDITGEDALGFSVDNRMATDTPICSDYSFGHEELPTSGTISMRARQICNF